MTIYFRIARRSDIMRIMEIIRSAQIRMGLTGTDQWQDGYPQRSIIENDVVCGWGYVALNGNDDIVAYAAIADYEEVYDNLQGEWLTAGDYLVVHRLAVDDNALRSGVATAFMKYAESLAVQKSVPSVRVDTNFDNVGMLAIFDKLGFKYCGKIYYESGERMAYELVLD